MVKPEQAAPVTGTIILYLEDYWSCVGGLSAVNTVGTQLRDLINKHGTGPMAVGGLNIWTPPRKAIGIPRVSTRFSLRVENEQDDAGRDGRTRLSRSILRRERGQGNFM